MPKWLAAAATVLGALLGTATNLYSPEFRAALEASGKALYSPVLPTLVATLAASGATAAMIWWLIRRRRPANLVAGTLPIKVDALQTVESEQDSVVGRSLRFIEAKRSSKDLVILVHGLGLDADDFRPYMIESKHHCVALTLFGFNADDRDDEHYRPISLASHTQLLAYALRQIAEKNPRKRITLVGFSFGADLIFFLTEYASDVFADLKPHRVLLLDPNVDQSTTVISSEVAVLPDRPNPNDLIGILRSRTNLSEFRYLCEYLYKITAKNFAQIRRLAQEVVAKWDVDSCDRFVDYFAHLSPRTGSLHIVLSSNHNDLFNKIVKAALARKLDIDNLECPSTDHFGLIKAGFLKERLDR
jgi:pimeloyl-ACP methyl ester carboxylesterase